MLLVVVALVVALPISLVIHELGHALAALALGGHGVRVHTTRALTVAVSAEFTGGRRVRARRVAFVLAGPLASALVGAALVAAGAGGPESLAQGAKGPVALVGLVSVLFALVTLAGSDGRQALRLATGNDADAPAR